MALQNRPRSLLCSYWFISRQHQTTAKQDGAGRTMDTRNICSLYPAPPDQLMSSTDTPEHPAHAPVYPPPSPLSSPPSALIGSCTPPPPPPSLSPCLTTSHVSNTFRYAFPSILSISSASSYSAVQSSPPPPGPPPPPPLHPTTLHAPSTPPPASSTRGLTVPKIHPRTNADATDGR